MSAQEYTAVQWNKLFVTRMEHIEVWYLSKINLQLFLEKEQNGVSCSICFGLVGEKFHQFTIQIENHNFPFRVPLDVVSFQML